MLHTFADTKAGYAKLWDAAKLTEPAKAESVAKAIVAARKLLEAPPAEKKEEPSAEERRRMTVLVKSLMKSLMKSSVALFEALLAYFELTDDSQLLTCMLKQCKDPFMATEIRTLAASMKRFAVV